MAIRCPDCGRRVRTRSIDVERDRARCDGCGKVMSYSAVAGPERAEAVKRLARSIGGADRARPGPAASGDRPAPGEPVRRPDAHPAPHRRAAHVKLDPTAIPRGAWWHDDGVTLEVGATTRSIGLAIVMAVVAVIWLPMSGGFAAFAVVGMLQGIGLVPGSTSPVTSFLVGLFALAFATPFLLAGWWLVCMVAMSLAGRDSVSVRGDELTVFSGVGSLGKARRLSASAVERVEEHAKVTRTKHGTSTTRTIQLICPDRKPVKFGHLLTDPRRTFVLGVLQQVLRP